jgi:hypothetical protein
MDSNEKERERCMKLSDERGEFVTDVDGFVYFWPRANGGHFAAHHLRWLADELDARNKDWEEQIAKDLGSSCCENEERTMAGGCKNCGDPSF